MPSPTYVAIATTTVGSGGAANIDFQNIPQTYTDLLLNLSLREESTGSAVMLIDFNNTSANQTNRAIQGNPSTPNVTSNTATSIQVICNTSSYTASSFGSAQVYIPNYTSSNYKSVSSDSVSENNSSDAPNRLSASLWSDTAAINRITIKCTSAADINQYSTATLYGIKNS
jgi:hypothetical protein